MPMKANDEACALHMIACFWNEPQFSLNMCKYMRVSLPHVYFFLQSIKAQS